MSLKQKKRKQTLPVISLFSGAGGLDYGLEAAGFSPAVCVEMDRACCETLRLNRDFPVLEQKIEDVSSETILEAAGLKVGEAAMVVGGPPCQPFSKSGYWKNGDSLRLEDPRASTLEAYMRVLEDTLPSAFILENVFGLAYKGKDEGLSFLLKRLEQINRRQKVRYTFQWKVLNAANFGVPQVRERFFIIGSRNGSTFSFPEPQFHESAGPVLPIFGRTDCYRTAWDAIGDLDGNESPVPSRVGGAWGDLLPSIPEGENYLWHTARGGGKPLFGWRTRYWSFLLKLAKNRPSWTIQAQPGSAIGPFHWKNRRLTMREMARIQTFPDDVVVTGGSSKVQMQIGNAVPSLLAEVLGREVLRQVFGIKNTRELSLLPPLRDAVPPPEEVSPVPRKYKPVPVSARALRDEKQVGPRIRRKVTAAR